MIQKNMTTKVVDVPQGFLKIALALIAIVVLVGVGVAAYVWFSGGSGQSGTALTAPDLKVSPTGKLFHIVPENSEVRFIIDEILIGKPNTVTGVTNQVAGSIMIDMAHPEQTQLGTIRINVKTLQTDNEFRNRALRGQILQATQPEFEFATFVPKQIEGLPETISIGKAASFQIIGALTIRGITHDVTFDASVTFIKADRIEGTAKTVVSYRDFNINIPDAPGVADVSNDVRLEIDFVALPTES
jgi:polyisoprenoid-binding protein YceI